VREFVEIAARELDMAVRWEGAGLDEKGFDGAGRCIVAVDPRYFRPTEVETLLGDAGKARRKLGWSPKVSFEELVKEMIRADFEAAQRDDLVKRHGFETHTYHE
jgi:GDPmannose 4,6-dehydratase